MRTSQTRSGSPMWQSSVCLGRSCICPQFSICTAAIWSAIPYRIALCSAWWQPCWTRHLQKFQTEQTSFSIFLWAAQKWPAVFAGVPLHGALQTGTRCISGLLQHPQNQGKAKGLAACNSQTASPFGCLNNFYFKILSNFLGVTSCRMSSLHNWFFCRPPTYSSIWSKTILLHRYRVFPLPANIPAQSPASISDFRCQPHQRDDALCPFLLYAFPVKKSTKRVKKELSTCAVNSFCCIITLFKLRYNIRVKIRRRPTSPLPLLS